MEPEGSKREKSVFKSLKGIVHLLKPLLKEMSMRVQGSSFNSILMSEIKVFYLVFGLGKILSQLWYSLEAQFPSHLGYLFHMIYMY